MSTSISCPNCKFEFAPEEALAKNIEKEYARKNEAERIKMQQQFLQQQNELDKQLKEFDEKKKKENELFAEKI